MVHALSFPAVVIRTPITRTENHSHVLCQPTSLSQCVRMLAAVKMSDTRFRPAAGRPLHEGKKGQVLGHEC